MENKKRIIFRGAAYKYYKVKEYGNGCSALGTRGLVVAESISARILEDNGEGSVLHGARSRHH